MVLAGLAAGAGGALGARVVGEVEGGRQRTQRDLLRKADARDVAELARQLDRVLRQAGQLERKLGTILESGDD